MRCIKIHEAKILLIRNQGVESSFRANASTRAPRSAILQNLGSRRPDANLANEPLCAAPGSNPTISNKFYVHLTCVDAPDSASRSTILFNGQSRRRWCCTHQCTKSR
eukprot:IDg1855t1